MSPLKKAAFIVIASSFNLCIASSEDGSSSFNLATWVRMI